MNNKRGKKKEINKKKRELAKAKIKSELKDLVLELRFNFLEKRALDASATLLQLSKEEFCRGAVLSTAKELLVKLDEFDKTTKKGEDFEA